MQPMQRYMLPCLPLEAIASLRASCKTFQLLVDTAPAEAWQPAASASLLPTSMQHVSDLFNGSQDVQSMLLGQGLVIGNLRTGASRMKAHHFVHENAQTQATSLHWSPGWPSIYIAILLERRVYQEILKVVSGAVLMVCTRTWHALEASGRHRTFGEHQWGMWWPASWKETPVFVFASRTNLMAKLKVARVASEKLHVEDVHVSGPESKFRVASLAPGGSAVICSVLEDGPSAAAVCDMMTLQERFRIDAKALAAQAPAHVSQTLSLLEPAWVECNPALGEVVAVAWHAREHPECISFHDAASGRLLKQMHLADCMRLTVLPAGGSPPVYAWSPSGKHVVMHRNARNALEADPTGMEGGIFGLNGNIHELGHHPDAWSSKVEWSPCGRYLAITELAGHGDHEYAGGYIWDAVQQREVFDWDGKSTPANDYNQVVWNKPHDGALSCILLVQNCEVLLRLPAGTDRAEPERICYDAPHEHGGARWSLSPCGTLLVGTWAMRTAPGMYHVCDVPGIFDSRELDMPCHLWHAEIKSSALACCNREAACSMTKWCMDSIAWHPSPASQRIYAIAQEDGCVDLMDGTKHERLTRWSPEQLKICRGKSRVRLTWAPDGSQLAVAARGVTTILEFGI